MTVIHLRSGFRKKDKRNTELISGRKKQYKIRGL